MKKAVPVRLTLVILLCTTVLIGALLPGSHAASAAEGRKWALLVGISKYLKIDHSPCPYAVSDAKEMEKTLISSCGYRKENVFLLTSDQSHESLPDMRNIIKCLLDVSQKAAPEDSFIFFFSGLGMEMGNESFLLPWEADTYNSSTLVVTSLKVSDLMRFVARIKAGKIALFLDSSRNDPRPDKKASSGQDSQNSGQLKIVSGGSQEAPESHPVPIVLTACDRGECSYDSDASELGFFTLFLTRGLRGKAADAQGNVTLGSLKKYVRDNVPPAVQKALGGEAKQHPLESGGSPDKADAWVLCPSGKVK